MGTRANRTSGEHVQALNMIDLVFYGKRMFGNRRTKSEQTVLDAWKEYHDHLNSPYDDKSLPVWSANGDELFVNVLFAISRDVGFSFDRVQLKKGAYSPIAHGDFQLEQAAIRKLTVEVLAGRRAIKMDVAGLPSAPLSSSPQTPQLPEKTPQVEG